MRFVQVPSICASETPSDPAAVLVVRKARNWPARAITGGRDANGFDALSELYALP